jgi:hypothetical protein
MEVCPEETIKTNCPHARQMPISKVHSLIPILLLLACGYTQAVRASDAAPPAWVMEPPTDTPDKMWGAGEGSDPDLAKRSALKDMAARLRVAISGQVESRVTESRGSVDRFARTRLTEDVQRTEFKNYRLEKSAHSGQSFYALVSVDRRLFIAEAEQRLAAAEKEIARRLSGGADGNSIEKFIALQKALPWIEKAVDSSQLLSAADPGFDTSRLIKHEAELSTARAAAGELTFDIRARSDSSDVANILRTFLNESGMRTGGGGTTLLVDTATVQDTIYGAHAVQLRINLRVLDSQKRNLASKEFISHGSSMTSRPMARQAALKKLGEQLRESGPFAALGFSRED